MPSHSHVPSTDTKPRYLLGAIKEFFNGWDNGAGYVKVALWALGLGVSAIYIPYILAGAFVLAVGYAAYAVYTEHKINKVETEKKRERQRLAKKISSLEEDLVDVIKQEIKWKFNLKEMSESKEAMLHAKLVSTYPSLDKNASLSLQKSNESLLRSLLRDYFYTLNSSRLSSQELSKRQKQALPKRQKILDLIEDVTGYHPGDADFHKKMHHFLKGDGQLQTNFKRFFSAEEKQQLPENSLSSSIKKNALGAWQAFKRQKRKRQIAKGILEVAIDFMTGAGIVSTILGVLTVANVIVATAPLLFPFIGALVVGGLAFATISLAIRVISTDRAKKNLKYLNREIDQHKTKITLIQRLTKIHKKSHSLQEKAEGLYQMEDDFMEEDEEQNQKWNQKQKKPKIPASVYARMIMGTACHVILGAALAIAVGIGIAYLGTLIFPSLAFVSSSLWVGGSLSIFYVYRSIKEQVKSKQNEIKKIQRVEEKKQRFQEKHKGNNSAIEDLKKSRRNILKELIQEYICFINYQREQGCLNNRHYPKQEKIFSIIEEVAGIERGEDENGRLLPLGDDRFYNQLAYYIKGHAKDSTKANDLVQKFKDLFQAQWPKITETTMDANDPLVKKLPITKAKVDANDPGVKEKPSAFKKCRDFFKKHTLAFLGVAVMGFSIPFFLSGGLALSVIVPVACVIVGAYLISRYTDSRSKKNVLKLSQEETKLKLIEHKHKIINLKKVAHASPTVKRINSFVESRRERKQVRPDLNQTPRDPEDRSVKRMPPRKTSQVNTDDNMAGTNMPKVVQSKVNFFPTASRDLFAGSSSSGPLDSADKPQNVGRVKK
jgi:membrane protein implicated in regulation of membrane protease activity